MYLQSVDDMLASAPKLIYGTAWKGERTKSLVEQAVLCGFRAIDTACQPKHYNQKGVGEALVALRRHGITREHIFVQTKFTPLSGHDGRVPYDPRAPIETQVAQSFEVSKKELHVDFVDSLVLHSPYQRYEHTLEAWRAMETIHDNGGAKQLGISNIYDLTMLQQLYDDSVIKPSVVQNRFYAETLYDRDLRTWCRTKSIRYQSFWTLTANPHVLRHPNVVKSAKELGKTPAQLLFRYLLQSDADPLTGTTSEQHMKEDLDALNFTLDDETMRQITLALGISN